MTAPLIAELDKVRTASGPEAALDRLITSLRDEKRYDDLFDATLLKRRHTMGLSLARPTFLGDVPADKRDEFEKFYIQAAREAGEAFLADGNIPKAWLYLRAINEPEKVSRAIEALPITPADEKVIEIAFFEGASPVRGIQMLLASHGTCSTITSFDQQMQNLPPAAREGAAAVLVSELYRQLRDSLQADVQRRQPMAQPGQSLKELIAGREELFANDNYHIDVSHLNSTVRFARSLPPGAPELKLASQLALYGSKLAPQYQYGSSAPFQDYYPAHIQFFRVLLDDGRDEGIKYFRDKLTPDPTEQENQLTAFILVDLLQRIGQGSEASELACKYLADVGDQFGISISELCLKSGRADLLKQISQDQNDPVGYVTALLSQ